MVTEAEIGVTVLQTKEFSGLLEARQGKGESSPRKPMPENRYKPRDLPLASTLLPRDR